VTARIQPGF